eukprot:6982474-Alexandrium_andersonii.AAC.1
MSASLVGSEMCIRDSTHSDPGAPGAPLAAAGTLLPLAGRPRGGHRGGPVSYTHLTLPTICSV